MKRRELYFTLGKIKVLQFFNIKFSFNMSYFCHYYFLNSLYFDMAIKPFFKVQNIALINVNYNEKELIKGMKN